MLILSSTSGWPLVAQPEDMPTEHRGNEQLVAYWKQDWSTRGDWCERYGQSFALLCGSNVVTSDIIASIPCGVRASGRIGGHRKGGGMLASRYVHASDDHGINTAFNPETGIRSLRVWTDRGKDYPSTFDGPDIWVAVRVPAGLHELSLYFHNADHQDLDVGMKRDFLVEIRTYQSQLPVNASFGISPLSEYPDLPTDCLEKETLAILKEPVLARARVNNFGANGVHQIFLVKGGRDYYVRIARNYSSDTILGAIFLTPLDQDTLLPSLRQRPPMSYTGVFPSPPSPSDEEKLQNRPLMELWESKSESADRSHTTSDLSRLQQKRLLIYRRALADGAGKNITGSMRWHLRLWNEIEHQQFEHTMLDSWHTGQERVIARRSQEIFPDSPRTIPFKLEECQAIEYMGLDWKQYLPERTLPPQVPPEIIREKVSAMTEEDMEELRHNYNKRINQ